jgi:4-amino-4-deoxy-L-arabinose transferase-like glycosyltransferase
MEARPALVLGVFVYFYGLTTLVHGQKRFWYDELFTFYISRMPNFSTIWAALMDGLDFNPPFLYAVTRLSHALFGMSPFATRLPEVIGFLVMCLCVFVFVRRRFGNLYGFVAMFLPPITGAYYYATEARTYGLVLGWAGLATVFWQRATEGNRRGFALAGFFISVTGMITTQCWSILVFAAFGIAEVVRFAHRKKPDWALWFCYAVPGASGLIYLPMLHNVQAYAIDSIWFQPGVSLAPRFYNFLFQVHDRSWEPLMSQQMIWPFLIALVLLAFYRQNDANENAEPVPRRSFPRHEIAYSVALCLIPLLGQALATLVHTQFLDRYALSAVIGFSALFSGLAWRAVKGRQSVGALIALTFFGYFLLSFGAWFNGLLHHDRWELPVQRLSVFPAGMPIVVTDPIMFLEADYFETPEIASRLVFLTDRTSALRYTGTDVFDRGYYRMKKWFPIHGRIVDYSDFVRSTPVFAVAGPYYNPEDWVLRRLTADRLDLRVLAQVRYPSTSGEEAVFGIVRPAAVADQATK